jgi:hypothetical protein
MMAALASAGSLTKDQQSILQEFFDPQDDDSSISGSDSDSENDNDQQASAAACSTGAQAPSAGVGVGFAAAGVGVSTAAVGVAVAAELPAAGQPAKDSTSKMLYTSLFGSVTVLTGSAALVAPSACTRSSSC